MRFRVLAAIAPAMAVFASAAVAQDRSAWRLDLESGATFQTKNEVRNPGNTGTQFNLNALQGDPVSPFFRATLAWDPWQRHGFLVAYQYLRNEGSGTLLSPTNFANTTFAPGVRTTGDYRFDTWRATYRYTLVQTPDFRLRVGLTGLIRDAEIRLSQNGITRSDSNVGFVPLLHASFDWRIAPRVSLMGELDGLAAPQGGALDIGLRAGFDVTPQWQATVGWRMLTGGVDNDTTYNFARFQSVTAGLAYRF
jgi:hypothetical protein